jgi:NADH-quinone oxidoreductase subunit G
MNYIFNSSIEGIENADLILLIGTNPRHEATMLNARIRKVFAQKKIPIFSIGNPGNLTYDYKIIGDRTDDIKKIINKESDFSKKFLTSKKPIIIIGESALELKSGKYIFETIKKFLHKNNFITKEWNALNVLTQNASTVGLIDLKILPNEKNDYSFFDKLNNGKFKFLYLLGSDNLEIKKNNEFIVYQGCHGDRGAEIADVILPNAAYTEQSGLYENLEGRVQECRKASYPIGEAKEDWRIFNLIYKKIDEKNTAFKFDFLRKEAIEQISNFTSISELPIKTLINQEDIKTEFLSEEIKVKPLDYYYSNSISRASKTMSDCRQVNQKIKKTG